MKIISLFAGAILAASTLPVCAQDYPTKSITWVVPFTPGGQADTAARVVAKLAGEKMGQPIVIDNKPGAGGIVGAEYVMNAKPDGYTIFYGSSGPMGILPKLMKNISYDPVKNFEPLVAMAISPLVLLIPPGKPYKTFKEFVDYAKANPDKLSYSSVGIGSTHHLGGELLAMTIGAKMAHIPYKGSSPAVIDLLGGRIDVAFDNYTPVKPHIDAGKLIPLAVAAEKRLTSLPNVPTTAELGIPDVKMASWSSLAAPKGTPDAIVEKWSKVMTETMADPTIVKFYEDSGSTVLQGVTKEKAREFYESEGAKFKLIIEKSGATAE